MGARLATDDVFLPRGKIGPVLYTERPRSQDSRMPFGGRRLLTTLVVLAALGFCAGVLVLAWMSRADSPATTPASTTLTPSVGRAADGTYLGAATRPNPAAQKAGLPDPAMQSTA